ncbi:PREDICTED: uncharacterized protein LOC104709291 [Camelina sativa]|uniref:Uncharacterized protein LOC104709291 n=1 Tax=Camelina sativa TaxID=90675 RepID=A0ABM0TCL0_CAMSA|nr:PREDICTED: uncharacterized protein LOC104709291 [Camelina sativa]
MVKLGFDQIWITWIMAMVRSVSYSVLINGSPYGDITPKRGLRQGDPISPYLFLFCAEMLTQKIHQAESRGDITGLSISNHGPRVTHLLFADDSFFFCQANSRNSRVLARILHQYGQLSRQCVNLNKSSITFGSKVEESKKDAVKRHINITRVGGCGKYLGLPEEFSRRKCQMFEYIVTRVKERTRNWHTKYLSEAVKEVLLKSVAFAMPSHAMGCFKLPLTICQEIDSLFSQFWWGSDESKRRISWVSWKRLNLPKSEGGLGFHDIEKFNDALLAKQVWKILNSPECLLTKILKSRYFPATDIRTATLGKKPSHG